ncbi:hypothetical protein [Pontibacter virosus]|uniref:SpoIIAA-like protein n=1 Tax=Pontibacter virosus TaxID=1765052 RepID=A0A2U1B3A3_9BACT|nr:hypothetical protein [Pontibacter virosus]PVY43143.1 hypothetical protein C8E01_102320 [Pontibacter virosus]
MILFENSIIKLDYNPATDIIAVEYPDLHQYLLPEIKHTIDIMVDIIKSYDIKKLLLDSRRTLIDVTEEESREIASYMAAGVMKTRIQKVARIQSPSEKIEKTSEANIKHISETHALPFQLLNFTNKEAAIEWLRQAE